MGVCVPARYLLRNAANMGKSFKLFSLVARLFTTGLVATRLKVDGYSMFPFQLESCNLLTKNLDSICSSSSALQAYKLVFNSKGQPNLQLAAQSVQTHGCHGSPTVTSLNGQPGTAIVSCQKMKYRKRSTDRPSLGLACRYYPRTNSLSCCPRPRQQCVDTNYHPRQWWSDKIPSPNIW